jgi:hypothetical protein
MSDNYRAQLLDVNGIIANIDFLQQGWEGLKSPTGGRGDISWDIFLKVLLRVASQPADGMVVLYTSKNMKPLGFMVVMDNTELFGEERKALIYAGYSNGKYAHAAKDGMDFVEQWARAHNFVALEAHTRRINGSAMRLFRKKLGFHPLSLVFKKEL